MTSERDSAADRGPLPPGSTLGILGGGQLGRMIAIAAARLGYKSHIYCPEVGCPAFQVATAATAAAYDDQKALSEFADAVDVVTTEFEDVPAASLALLDARKPVRPSPSCQKIAQDRWHEKSFAATQGIATAPFIKIDSVANLRGAVAELGTPAVLKTRRLGYDGKGQIKIDTGTDPEAAWQAVGAVPSILESFVAFDREISVIIARGVGGESACYVPGRERAYQPHPRHDDGAGTDPRVDARGRGRSDRAAPGGGARSRRLARRRDCSWLADGLIPGQRDRALDPTIPVIGRSTRVRSASSSSSSALCAAFRWARRTAIPTPS